MFAAKSLEGGPFGWSDFKRFLLIAHQNRRFSLRNRCVATKKPFLIGKLTIIRVLGGLFMKINAFQGKIIAVATNKYIPS